MTAQSCFAQFSTLNAAPYSIPWGQAVWARVQASNAVNAGAWSTEGNGGAIILTTPDAPQTLTDNVIVTTTNKIGLNWYEGISYGGTPVIDYRVWY